MARRRGDLTGTSMDNKSGGSDIIGADSPGTNVKMYQGMLIELGYLPPGSDTGVKDAKTLEAVKKFQVNVMKIAGAGGDVGPKTIAAMTAAVAAKRAADALAQQQQQQTPPPQQQQQQQPQDPTRPQSFPAGYSPYPYGDPANVQRLMQQAASQGATSVTIPGIGTIPVDPKLISSVLPGGGGGGTTVTTPGGGTVTVPGTTPGGPLPMPTGLPGFPMGLPGTPTGLPGFPMGLPFTPPPQVQPQPQPQTQPEQKKDDDKILGMPKNLAIGGGVALGLLAIFGIYMMTRKSGSQSETSGYGRYTDEDGRKYIIDPMGVAYPAGFSAMRSMTGGESDSLSERARRLHAHPRHRRY